jgi:hypothetical protein
MLPGDAIFDGGVPSAVDGHDGDPSGLEEEAAGGEHTRSRYHSESTPAICVNTFPFEVERSTPRSSATIVHPPAFASSISAFRSPTQRVRHPARWVERSGSDHAAPVTLLLQGLSLGRVG